MDIEKEIIEMRERLDAMMKAHQEQNNTVWPQAGDTYWTYTAIGQLFNCEWTGIGVDKDRKVNHLIFRIREEAALSLSQGVAYRMLWKLSDGGLYSIRKGPGIYVITRQSDKYGLPKFSSHDKAQAAITKIGTLLLDSIFEDKENEL